MKTKLPKYLAQLRQWKWRSLLGQNPTINIDVSCPLADYTQVCLSVFGDADYYSIDDCVERLGELQMILLGIKIETEKMREVINKIEGKED